MKLKNKKTGEIVSLEGELLFDNEVMLLKQYASLAELNAEWEDVPEEPKEYWYIGDSGEVWGFSHYYLGTEIEEAHRKIGNYFETKEEAELAVEKLKAWKRLKDKGFRFGGHDNRDRGQLGDIVIYAKMPTFEYDDSTRDDLDLLFGGEE